MTVEDIEKKRKRLIFRSWHRGTREMDLVMGSFAESHVAGFSDSELSLYDEILKYADPDLYNWVSGKEELPSNYNNSVMEKLLHHNFTD